MKKVIVISTSLRTGSNSDMLADQFIEGAKAAGHEVEKISEPLHDYYLGDLCQCGGLSQAYRLRSFPKVQAGYFEACFGVGTHINYKRKSQIINKL